MIFNKVPAVSKTNKAEQNHRPEEPTKIIDEVETVVGPSVNVEGDFASEGNIVVKGSVAGSVRTSHHLSVEEGARIMANVRSGSARIAGEVRGNMRVKDSVELTATARILGDINAKVLMVEPGAIISGKVTMPGIEKLKKDPKIKNSGKKSDSETGK